MDEATMRTVILPALSVAFAVMQASPVDAGTQGRHVRAHHHHAHRYRNDDTLPGITSDGLTPCALARSGGGTYTISSTADVAADRL